MSLDPLGFATQTIQDAVAFFGSQQKAAQALGIPRSTLFDQLRGLRKRPSTRTVERIQQSEFAQQRQRELQQQQASTPIMRRSPNGYLYMDSADGPIPDANPMPRTTAMALRVRDPRYPDSWYFTGWSADIASVYTFAANHGYSPADILRVYWDTGRL